MGEITDDLIEGQSCSLCGIYFQKSHGYPVLCLTCWNEADVEGRLGYGKTIFQEL